MTNTLLLTHSLETAFTRNAFVPTKLELYHAAKRTFDITFASIMLVMLLPVFAVIALCIKLTDRGPVFFIQKRVGKNGVLFPFVKFRSMLVNAEALKAKLAAQNDHGANAVTFKMKKDPRVTWIGRLLRKSSMDELPQLWNVLRGEMSFVGPRPAVPAEVAKYTPEQRARLAVTPGLTCTWQVEGRGDIPFEGQVQMDLDYIARRSVRFDLSLILRTVPAILSGRGAY
ncbi:MAG: sugar transferase [Gemmataceae bacterium]